MRTVLINAQTAAQTVTLEVNGQATVVTKGLAGVESIAVNILTGTTFEPLLQDGVAVTFTVTAPQKLISWKGEYQFVKAGTAGAVTLQVTD